MIIVKIKIITARTLFPLFLLTPSHQFKLIMQQLANEGSAIFYSTHVLEVAEKICSHVAIIKNGKLMAHGTMDEVKGMKSFEKHQFHQL